MLRELREVESGEWIASFDEAASSCALGPATALEHLERKSASDLLRADELLVLLKTRKRSA